MQTADFKERLSGMITHHTGLFPELTQSKALQNLLDKNLHFIFR